MPVPGNWTALLDGADDARRDADRILERPKYQPSRVPRPFQGLLEWMGDRLRPVADVVSDVFDNGVVGALIAALIVVLVAVAAVLAIGRRDRRADTAVARRRDVSLDPDALERAADEAERAGELERALRLRFRAGLLRLHRSGVLDRVDGATSGQVADVLRVPEFDDLASTFDEVVYGGRSPSPDDVARAREAWPVVVSAARR